MAKLTLGKALKKKKLSKRQFAKNLGISYGNVWRLFRAGQNPRFSTLNTWAKAIGCRVRDLFEDS